MLLFNFSAHADYIPKTMVAAIKNDKDVPIQEHQNVVILCMWVLITQFQWDCMRI